MLPENSPAGTEVFRFQVSFSAGESMAAGFPQLQNFNPLTDAFAVSMENATHAKVGYIHMYYTANFMMFFHAYSVERQ